MIRAGAGAATTPPSSQRLQARFSRLVTTTKYFAGSTSNCSLTSWPITTVAWPQVLQVHCSGVQAITRSTRGNAAGNSCLDRTKLVTSMAQVFNELGEGVVVRGGPADLSKEDRQPHLTGESCQHLIADALAKYREVHWTLPARIVIHKSSPFSVDEGAGAKRAIRAANINIYDL